MIYMEFRITTRQVLQLMLILSWILFIGLCIEAGLFITHAIMTLVSPGTVQHLWQEADLSALFNTNQNHYFVVLTIQSIITVLEALLFYQVIRLLMRKDLRFAQPFNAPVRRCINVVTYISFLIALFSSGGARFVGWLRSSGISMPDTHDLKLGGGDVWLLMTVILFVIGQVFKRGIELQTENELTV